MVAMDRFSARDAARILQSTEAEIRSWARLGGLQRAGRRGRRSFTFQELLLLRTTRGLLEAGIPARRIRRVWSSLRRQLAHDLPLTSIRVLADGARAVAWDGNAPWQPDSGQFLLHFEAGELAEQSPCPTTETPPLSAEQWFCLGCDLESTSPMEARQAYRRALETDPELADAHVNLGRLDHEEGNLASAEAHYRAAARSSPKDPTCLFNLAVLLDDQGKSEEAIRSYREAIAVDPGEADAHYNLGLILERMGRRTEAMRHLMTARRIYAAPGRGR
jgi:tetratricopeptide (TPR) repeat protein